MRGGDGMELALNNIIQKNGIERREVEASLDYISNQLYLLDGKLKSRIDNEIWKLFQLEQQEIKRVEMKMANLLQYK